MGTNKTDVLVKVEKGDPLPPPAERAVVPYDPFLTLKKALSAAVVSAAAIVGGVALNWALEGDNIKLIANQLGLKGALGVMAIPLIHAVVVAGRNWLKTHKGVWFEQRPDITAPVAPLKAP